MGVPLRRAIAYATALSCVGVATLVPATSAIAQTDPPRISVVDTFKTTADNELTSGEAVELYVTQFTLTFQSAISLFNPPDDTNENAVINPNNYMLIAAGANTVVDTTSCSGGLLNDDDAISVDSVSYVPATKVATLSVNSGVSLTGGNYRLFVCSGPNSIVTTGGLLLDGDGDMVAGDDFALSFSILDTDGDGDPNGEDADDDGDGVDDITDLFPLDATESTDFDNDGIGDNSDPDYDGDGVNNGVDAFPFDPSETADSDADGVGDNADAFPNDGTETVDTDGDGVGDNSDAFPNDGTETADSDGDGVGDNADAFPNDGTETVDSDNDGVGDNSDAFPNDGTETVDSDNDGVGDNSDAFPNDGTETADSDGDGVGDNADAFPNDGTETVDTDNDGVGDNSDAFPNDGTETVDSDGDGVGDNADAFPNDGTETVDSDNDGVGDNGDAFPNDGTETVDSDGDGVGDNADAFPNDGTETADSDNDGVGDNADAFPNDGSETVDSDGDGVGDNSDAFPNDGTETADTDGDGVGDNADAFPNDATETVDTDSDGTGDNADLNDDGDAADDVDDAFPLDPTETTDTDGDLIGNNADDNDDGDAYTDAQELAAVPATDPLDYNSNPGFDDSFTVLLVDDDDNLPDVQSSYTNALDALGINYNVWETAPAAAGEPSAAVLAQYSTVIWMTGNAGGLDVGPESDGAAALGTWMGNNVGACLAMSSVNYIAERDVTPLAQTYFGVAPWVTASLVNGSVTGAEGTAFLDMGPYGPVGYAGLDGVDAANVAFTGNDGITDATAGVQKITSGYKAVLMAFGLENVGDPDAVETALGRVIGFCNPPMVNNVNTNKATDEDALDEDEVVEVSVTEFVLSFSKPVQDQAGDTEEDDVTNPANYLLVEAGLNDVIDTVDCAAGVGGDDVEIAVNSVTYDAASLTATVAVNDGAWLPAGEYALRVCGTTTLGLVTRAVVGTDGLVLDGDGDGVGEDDFIREFRVRDSDGDGYPDADDAFPFFAGEWFNNDGDFFGDNFDTDDDNDGEPDVTDAFPFDAAEQVDTDSDGIGNNADTDDDGDNVADGDDAFPLDGTESEDFDNDGIGDNSDPDVDGDNVDNIVDAFPFDPSESADSDNDGVGDNADVFPNDGTETVDSDNDGVGDNGDAFPNDGTETADSDGDGVGDNADAFPNDGTETADSDNDGVGDNADLFPNDGTETADLDLDGIGDNSDPDVDGDNVANADDAFPTDPGEWLDTDEDGIGNNADPDDDGDDIADEIDTDGDNDGMSNEFELEFGLNPSDPSDAGIDSDGDNYTNLQEANADPQTDPTEYNSNPSIDPLATVLVVDDDADDGSTSRRAYTDILEWMGVRYNVWDMGQADFDDPNPNLAALDQYRTVLWYTGYEADDAGPDSSGEIALKAWLDQGEKCLFLSSLNYMPSVAPGSFGQEYMGLATDNRSMLIGEVIGADEVSPDIVPYPDMSITVYDPGPGASADMLVQNNTGPIVAGISKVTANSRTTLWGFALESVAAPAARRVALERIFDACDHPGTWTPTVSLVDGFTDSNAYGNGVGDSAHKAAVTSVFWSDGERDSIVYMDGYDIGAEDEAMVMVNGQKLGHIKTGPKEDFGNPTRLVIPSSMLTAGHNTIVAQPQVNGWRWGVRNLTIRSFDNPDIPLVNGVADIGEYGWKYGTGAHNGLARATFTGVAGTDYMLKVNGFDIDVADKVAVYANGHFIGHLRMSENNALGKPTKLLITGHQVVDGTNQIEFVVKQAGWKWGVTSLLVEEFAVGPDVALIADVADDGEYGRRFGSDLHDGVVPVTFDATPGTDYVLRVTGFDVDAKDEIGVFVNNRLVNYLRGSKDNELNRGDGIALLSDWLMPTGNRVEFRSSRAGMKFGVTGLKLETVTDTVAALEAGSVDATQYGTNYGTEPRDALLSVTFDAEDAGDMLFRVTGYDVDSNVELQVFLNGHYIGNVRRGKNVELAKESRIVLPALLLQSEDNRLSIVQKRAGTRWGVQDMIVE